MENSPHDSMARYLIGDFLYGSTLEDLQHRIQKIPAIEKLLQEPPEFWINLLKIYITEGNHVFAKPPKEMITAVTVPSVKSIKFHSIQRICNTLKTEDNNVDFLINKMPCRFQLDVINTSFVRLYVLMDTSNLPSELRLYLPLFVELLDQCAIKRNGELVTYQEVVKQLADDTISISGNIGIDYSRFFCGDFAQVICLYLMVEEEKYEKSVQWIREILYQIVFEPGRIKSSVNKMVLDLEICKHEDISVMKTILTNMVYNCESNHWAASIMRQSHFLTKVLKKLESNPEEVIEKLNAVRENVTNPSAMTIHLSANLENLKKIGEPEKPWIEDFLPSNVTPGIMNSPIRKCHELVKINCRDVQTSYIFGNYFMESSCLIQCAPCVTSRKDPDYAPLLVLLMYLTQTEGPMWRQIRGLGLAYSYKMFINPDSGLVYFILSESAHLIKGYKEALTIVEAHSNGTAKWEQEFFESATSSLVFDTIKKVKTVKDVTAESLEAYYADTDTRHTQELLEKISQVTHADMERVGAKYLKPLFDCTVSKCVVCCNWNKVAEIIEGFQQFSRNFTELPSLENGFMTQY